MTTPGEKKTKREPAATTTPPKPFAQKLQPGHSAGLPTKAFKPNRNTIAMRPYKHVEMTKAEMQEMLRKAAENTK